MGSQLSLVILAVSDLERAAAFYRVTLGLTATVEVPVYTELLAENGVRLGLYRRDSFVRNTGTELSAPPRAPTTTATELYWYVDDLDAAGARLHDAGATLLSPAALRPWGELAAYWRDPDGNVLVVALRSAA